MLMIALEWKPGFFLSVKFGDGGLFFKKTSKFRKDKSDHILIKNETYVPRKLAIGLDLAFSKENWC